MLVDDLPERTRLAALAGSRREAVLTPIPDPDPSQLAHKRPRTLLAGGSETLTLRREADVQIQGKEREPPTGGAHFTGYGGRAGKGVVMTGRARPEVLIGRRRAAGVRG
jgi:hypothetical protein